MNLTRVTSVVPSGFFPTEVFGSGFLMSPRRTRSTQLLNVPMFFVPVLFLRALAPTAVLLLPASLS